tara:strand:+ start:486 stop:842 length:357 start_codon:yes stop_codon:yes gene_type:complete
MFYLLIGIGAFVGAISRQLMSSYLSKLLFFGFPAGTLLVNVTGCYLIGMFLAINLNNKDLVSPLLLIGFLGSFTTFSAFTKEIFLFSNVNGVFVSYLVSLIISSTCVFSTFLGFKMFS